MSLEWLGAALLGLTFTCAPPRFIFFPAQFLRAMLWMILLSLGTQVRPTIRLLSLVVGLFAALPLFSTILPTLTNNSETRSVMAYSGAVLFTSIARFLLRPGTAFNWPLIRAWEQEVISRPSIAPFPFTKLVMQLNSTWDPRNTSMRVWSLSKQLSQTEFQRSSAVDEIILRGTGILILHISTLLIPSDLNQFRPEITLCFASFSLYSALILFSKKKPNIFNRFWFFIIQLPTASLFTLRRLLPDPYIAWLPKSQVILRYELIFVAISMALIGFALLKLSSKSWKSENMTLTAFAADTRYTILRKIAEIGKGLTNTRNIVTFLILIDLIAATLRISLTWL